MQIVGIHQFGSFSLGRSGHAREFVVHAEIVLQCDRRKRLVLFFDLDALFGFNRLVDTFTPATTFQNTTCKFVDDFYFATLNDVVLVAAVQLFGLESHLQLMDKISLHFVVQVFETQLGFDSFNTSLGRHDNALVFFYFVINIALESTHD